MKLCKLLKNHTGSKRQWGNSHDFCSSRCWHTESSKRVLIHGWYVSSITLHCNESICSQTCLHFLLWGPQWWRLCLTHVSICNTCPSITHRMHLNRCKYLLFKNCKLLPTILFYSFLLHSPNFLPTSKESYHLVDDLVVLSGMYLNNFLPSLSLSFP